MSDLNSSACYLTIGTQVVTYLNIMLHDYITAFACSNNQYRLLYKIESHKYTLTKWERQSSKCVLLFLYVLIPKKTVM